MESFEASAKNFRMISYLRRTQQTFKLGQTFQSSFTKTSFGYESLRQYSEQRKSWSTIL